MPVIEDEENVPFGVLMNLDLYRDMYPDDDADYEGYFRRGHSLHSLVASALVDGILIRKPKSP